MAALKGDERMAAVLAAAVRDRQRVPADTIKITVDGNVLRLRPAGLRAGQDRRAPIRPAAQRRAAGCHERTVVAELAGQLADGMADPAGRRGPR